MTRTLRLSLVTLLFLLAITGSAEARQAQIIGGSEAQSLPPGMASLQLRQAAPAGGRAGHFCGGTLVRPRWVLTAAHCISGQFESIDVLLGTRDLLAKKPERRPVVAKYIHPFYDGGVRDDIALLYLGSASRQPTAGLPDTAPVPGQTITAYGWGARKSNFPQMLQQTSLSILPWDDDLCSWWSHDRSTFCVAEPSNTQGICRGDSGGPAYGPDGKILGVASFAGRHPYLCVDPAGRMGFARVGTYLNWINGQMDRPPSSYRKQSVGRNWATVPDFMVWSSRVMSKNVSRPYSPTPREALWAEVGVNRAIRSAELVIPSPGGEICTVDGIDGFSSPEVCSSNGRIPLVVADGGAAAGAWFFAPKSCYRGAYVLARVGNKTYKRYPGLCF